MVVVNLLVLNMLVSCVSATCTGNLDTCPSAVVGEEIQLGKADPASCITYINAYDSNLVNTLFIAGRSVSSDVTVGNGFNHCFWGRVIDNSNYWSEDHVGYVMSYVNGAQYWKRTFHGENTPVEDDGILEVPWVGASRSA